MVWSGCRFAVDSLTKRPVAALRNPLDFEDVPPCDTDVLGWRAAAALLMKRPVMALRCERAMMLGSLLTL